MDLLPLATPVCTRLAAFGTLTLGLAACGSSRLPPPSETELTATRSAVAQAEQAGAADHAPLELRSARQKLEQAEAALREGEGEAARFLIAEALVDAELAQTVARSTQAQAAVNELQESIRALREEVDRNRRGDR